MMHNIAASGDDGDLVVMVIVVGMFIVVPICLCLLAMAGKIDLNRLRADRSPACPRCQSRRKDRFCAECGLRQSKGTS